MVLVVDEVVQAKFWERNFGPSLPPCPLESRYWKLEKKRGLYNCNIGRRADPSSPITCNALDAYPSLTEVEISREVRNEAQADLSNCMYR